MKLRAAPMDTQPPDGALTEFVPYVYRGTGYDTLTAGASWRSKSRYKAKPTGPCPACGWGLSGRKHRQICGPE